MLPLETASELRFGAFRLDLQCQRLWRDGDAIDLRPKAWQALVELARRPGALVSSDTLFDALWPQQAVGPKVLTNLIGELRRALGDDQDPPAYIQTVYRRGYRFVADVQLPPPVGAGLGLAPVGASAPQLVGRHAERARFQALRAAAASGQRQLVLIGGEPGVGKSALVEAEAAAAAADGWQVGRGACIEQSGEREAFGALLALIGGLATGPEGGTVTAALRRFAPCWLAQMPWLTSEDEAQSLRASLAGVGTGRMLREGCVLFEALAAQAPLLLVLEDLHWADTATVDLLSFLAQARGPSRLMLVASLQPVAAALAGHPIDALSRRMVAHGLLTSLNLPPLDEAETLDFIARRFGDAALAQRLAPQIGALAGGNPLYLGALLDHLIDRGELVADTARPGGWRLRHGGLGPLLLPAHLRALLEDRFARLGADDRRMLEAASTIGVQFALPLLAAALDEPALALEQRFARLERQGLFLKALPAQPWPDGSSASAYAFSHDIYRRALYEGIAPGQRRHWHLGVAHAFEQAWASRVHEVVGPLAFAYAHAGDPDATARVLQMAAEVASARFAHDEACEALEAALAQLAQLPETPQRVQQALTLWLLLYSVALMSRGVGNALSARALASAQACASRAGSAFGQLRVQMAACLSDVLLGQPQRAQSLARQFVPVAHRDFAPWVAMAEVYASIAELALGNLATALSGAERALAQPVELRAPVFLDMHTLAQQQRARTLLHAGQLDAAAQTLQLIEARARAGAVPSDLQQNLYWLADSWRWLGRIDRAAQLFDEALDLAERNAQTNYVLASQFGRQLLRPPAGRDLALMQQLWQQVQASGARWGELTMLCALAETELAQGQPQRARVSIDLALQRLDTYPLLAPLAHLAEAEWRAATAAAPAEVEAAYAQLRDATLPRGLRLQALRAAHSLAQWRASQGQHTQARVVLDEALADFAAEADWPTLQAARHLRATLPD
jgi:DNA-binding winged helix-turn-helix (wHTH) protein/tetratricopeptide (TPR) repeat protein